MRKIFLAGLLISLLISAMMFSACQPKKPESVKYTLQKPLFKGFLHIRNLYHFLI